MSPSRALLMSLALGISLGVSLANPGLSEPAPAPRAKFDSPRLATLAAELDARMPDVLEKFWVEVKGKSPLVEPDPASVNHRWVTFLFRGDTKTRAVGLLGGMPDAAHTFKPLTRLGDSDLWFRSERLPSDARFQYNFVLDPPASFPRDKAGQVAFRSKLRADPLNPNALLFQPMVELPDAPPQIWTKLVDGVPLGTLTEAKVPSRLLGREWSVNVYTPPGYDPRGDPLGLLVVFDGIGYRLGGVPTILNNLLAKKRIAPLVVVFVGHREREKELGCSDTFAEFLAKDLVPWVRENYQVTADPARTAVGGFSLGGLMASYCAFRHPSVFGNVLSQSGSYWWYPAVLEPDHETLADSPQGWLTREFVRSKQLPVRFFLAAGSLETGYPINLLESNRRFRDVLEAKGYTVTYSECSSDHSLLNWRGSFADGVIALFGR